MPHETRWGLNYHRIFNLSDTLGSSGPPRPQSTGSWAGNGTSLLLPSLRWPYWGSRCSAALYRVDFLLHLNIINFSLVRKCGHLGSETEWPTTLDRARDGLSHLKDKIVVVKKGLILIWKGVHNIIRLSTLCWRPRGMSFARIYGWLVWIQWIACCT